ncbi:hypothetical protein HE1_00320 [Holospora elegans E1]|uniref:Thioredoxin-like fold domain-containing protein n=1 Tax=Holospora elegans E1 TaxID=1427503 RepID=A0A023DYG5_9PROT|nr:thioredoxin domain-containing protein [Holospora elegans]GAJ46000.1 hypothetical protein HE1_00320 [Holospora elegans E1]
MILSVLCIGIGVYLNHWTSLISKKSDFQSQEVFQERYIKTEFFKKGDFYLVFHKPSTVPVTHTLIAFTSLACRVCSAFHNEIFLKIQSLPLYTSGALRVVFVEYPADRVSFFAGGYVWASKNPSSAREALMKNQPMWNISGEFKQSSENLETLKLEKVKKILKTKNTLSKKELTTLFEKKMQAQKIFGITDVPFFVLYQPNNPKGSRIKTRIGEVEWDNFHSWLEIAFP